ncbi:MAG: hypothetical protein D8M58_03725 [Calditrichaeota bacterium]|nr:MAG: hypothetical protein DWQ03_03350 [Calditrichota bacterium]MBL1204476.1 hypothetical protein [Calditrichota bacterium]NOG44305.1 hypothetical protein [Calditrichota bacterium]
MDDQLELQLQNILQKNRIVWGAVLFGMISLILISVALYYLDIIDRLPVVHPQKADNIALFVILFFVLLIFYIKQTILTPAKLIEKSKKPGIELNNLLAPLASDADEKKLTFLKCVQIFNKKMLIVWFLADLVVLTAFVNFILAPVLNKFIMYSFVGLFSLIINFPNLSIYKRVHRYLYE